MAVTFSVHCTAKEKLHSLGTPLYTDDSDINKDELSVEHRRHLAYYQVLSIIEQVIFHDLTCSISVTETTDGNEVEVYSFQVTGKCEEK